jgi:4-hydroxybenzoate polyprenyltransferase
VRGSVFTADDLPAWLLLLAVTLWIGGFDVIYACQDVEFDNEKGLHSIPARFGIQRGLLISTISHVLTVVVLVVLGLVVGLGWVYWLGVTAVAALLIYEHSLVNPQDLSKLGIAFFNVNGYISVTIFIATFIAVVMRS